MKISILYSSKTGKTERVAKLIEEGVKRSGNIEVKTMNLDAVDKKFLQESEGIIFGTPTYYANISWEMKNG